MFRQGFITGAATAAGLCAALFYKFSFNQNGVQNNQSQTTAQSSFMNQLKYIRESHLRRGEEILHHGVPDSGHHLRFYGNHVLLYDQSKKIPRWVAEHITKNHVKGHANRKHSRFKPDPGIPGEFTADNQDYWKSGWSRGHMAPAGNNKFDQEAMDNTFYLSNVLPQNYENNAGFWNRLEIYCRELTERFSDVWIYSGPVMMSNVEEDGKQYVKYQVIGKSEVAVPTHLYKLVIVRSNSGKSLAVGAFIVPNQPLSFEHKLKEYQVPLEQLESKVGVKFVPQVDRHTVDDLCSVDTCQLMSHDNFERYFIGRKLSSANNLRRLEKVWSELEDKNLKPDDYLIKLYNTKRKEFHDKEL